MSIRMILAATAVLAFAAPAMAQDAPPPAPAPPVAEAMSPEQAAIEAKGEVFKAGMETMAGEMRTAIVSASGDQAKADADLAVIVARYQPQADAFAAEVSAFITGEAAKAPEQIQQAEVDAAIAGATNAIRGIPGQIRASLVAAASAPPAAPAAPQ